MRIPTGRTHFTDEESLCWLPANVEGSCPQQASVQAKSVIPAILPTPHTNPEPLPLFSPTFQTRKQAERGDSSSSAGAGGDPHTHLLGHWATSRNIFGCHNRGGEGVLLARLGPSPGILIDTLWGTGQPPPQRMIQPQTSIVLRLRYRALKDTDSHPGLLTMTTSKGLAAAPPAEHRPIYISRFGRGTPSLMNTPMFLVAEPRLREAKAPGPGHTVRK